MTALAGAALANTLGNIVERNVMQDNNTGFNPLAQAAVFTPPSPKATTRYEI